jgi:hypothetical protein
MSEFLDKIYTLINHHLNYTKRLRLSMETGVAFQHQSERECEFGRLFYGQVYPCANQLPAPVGSVILEIEELHRKFHHTACYAHDETKIKEMYHLTDLLISRLVKLEKLGKDYTIDCSSD